MGAFRYQGASHALYWWGTPTAISAEQLDYLLSHLQKNLDLSKLEEFTIEANPGDLTVDKIEVLKKSAVNRVSLGFRLLMTSTCVKLAAVTIKHRFMKVLIA